MKDVRTSQACLNRATETCTVDGDCGWGVNGLHSVSSHLSMFDAGESLRPWQGSRARKSLGDKVQLVLENGLPSIWWYEGSGAERRNPCNHSEQMYVLSTKLALHSLEEFSQLTWKRGGALRLMGRAPYQLGDVRNPRSAFCRTLEKGLPSDK